MKRCAAQSTAPARPPRCVPDARSLCRRRLVDELGMDIKKIVVTSCDADTFFHSQHFAELTYNFCSDPERYCRFWQTPIVVRAPPSSAHQFSLGPDRRMSLRSTTAT